MKITDQPKANTKAARTERLFGRYDRAALETGMRLQGEFFLRMVEEFDQLDQDWTAGWLTWIYNGLYGRRVLDEKTRVLIVVGECCVLGEQVQLPNHIRSALRLGATPKEIVEVVLQSAIYGGMPRMIQSMRTCRSILGDLGVLPIEEPVFRGDARE